jgi:hypothetical protein
MMFDDTDAAAEAITETAAEAPKAKRVRKPKLRIVPKAKVSKPKAKRAAKRSAKRPARKAKKREGYGPREGVTMRVLHANPKKAAPEKTLFAALQKAFGRGKTIGDAVEWMETHWEAPRSERYGKDPRGYLLGYISRCTVAGFLLYGKA